MDQPKGASPLHLENLAHNRRAIQYAKSTCASLAGATCGVLGQTNSAGLLLYGAVMLLVVPSALALFKGDRLRLHNVGKSSIEVWTGGLVENVFSFLLWWTLLSGLVHL